MAKQLTRDVVNDLREQTNIVEVISRYMNLEKRGKNYIGLCPFHNEKTPSFYVYEDTKRYKCYGCGEFGDAFDFVGSQEGVSFPEAVQKVAEIEQIPLNFVLPATTKKEKVQHQPLYDIYEVSCQIFEGFLSLNTGNEAYEYLLSRGLTDEMIQNFRLGFSPNQDVLAKILLDKGFTKELMVASGLFRENDSGELRDFFKGRVLFPIRNGTGKVIAFSGRVLPGIEELSTRKLSKYKNSIETPIFKKSQILFNLDLAKKEARKIQELYVFEGQFDVIRAYQSGIQNVVGTMGTALSNEHLENIKKITKEVILSFDGDNAGLVATDKAIQKLQEVPELIAKVVRIPEKLDPDEYLKKYGDEALRNVLRNARESVFLFRKHFLKRGKNLANEGELIQYMNELIQELVRSKDHLQAEYYLEQLSEEFPNFKYERLFDRYKELSATLNGTKSKKIFHEYDETPHSSSDHFDLYTEQDHFKRPLRQLTPVLPKNRPKKSKEEHAEQALIYYAIQSKNVRDVLQAQADFTFLHQEYKEIFTQLLEYFYYKDAFGSEFLERLSSKILENMVIEILNPLLSFPKECSKEALEDYIEVVNRAKERLPEKEKYREKMHQADISGNFQLAQQHAKKAIEANKRNKI